MPVFKTTIGLEIHVQLATKSKMFCRCDNSAFGKEPNKTVCSICLGMPGMLPVTNKQAVEWTIKTGLALGCEINKLSKFDRKHYFYPDLPKGYQISQYDQPLCKGGEVKIQDTRNHNQTNSNPPAGGQNPNFKTVRLNRIHLEEDAGKLIHNDGSSFVDLNRAGTPLMEIVTEPDISSPEDAAEFLRKLQKIVRDVVSVSEASMEKGHLRCDANIDVKDESGKMSPIVEIKNINSFKFVQKALEFEAKRLADDYKNWPEKKSKITRGFNSQTGETYEQRTKEEAADYRYFPEPDLPPIDTAKFDLVALKTDVSESEEEKISTLVGQGVVEGDAKVLANSMIKYDTYIKLSAKEIDSAFLAKVVVYNYMGADIELLNSKIDEYIKAIIDFSKNNYPKNIFQKVCMEIHDSNLSLDEIYKKMDINSIDNISVIAEKIVESHPKEVTRYKAGEIKLVGFFMGELMKQTKGMADPVTARTIIIHILDHKY